MAWKRLQARSLPRGRLSGRQLREPIEVAVEGHKLQCAMLLAQGGDLRIEDQVAGRRRLFRGSFEEGPISWAGHQEPSRRALQQTIEK